MTTRPTASLVGGPLAALLTLTAVAALAAPLPRPRAAAPARPVPVASARAVTDLPVAGNLSARAVPFSPLGAATDTFMLGAWGFQDYAGACQTRGWVGEDRAAEVYANVSGAVLVNRDIVGGFGPPATLTLPVPIAGTTIGTPGASAVDPSGRLVYFDVLNGPVLADPVAGTLSSFGPQLPTFEAWECAALDPATGRIVVAAKNPIGPVGLYAYPTAGGGPPVQIAGFGTVTDDTTVSAGQVTAPTQLAIDAAGDIFFTEPLNHRVRVLRANDSRLVTIAGTGGGGSTGDGGPAAAATLTDPTGLAVSPDGSTLYIADRGANRVRVVTGALGASPQIAAYAPVADLHYLVLSGGRLFALMANIGGGQQGGVAELLAGGAASAPSMGFLGSYSLYATAAEHASAQKTNIYDPGAPAADGSGGYFTSDQVTRVVYHVKADGTVEAAAGATYGVHMGSHALRVGADMTSAPQEVANWVRPDGYGNAWSQRLVSPPVTLSGPGTVLRFDFAIQLSGDLEGVLTGPGDNELLAVQVQQPDGSWVTVNLRLLDPFNGTYSPDNGLADGYGIFKAEVHFDTDVFPQYLPAGPTRLRFVVQTPNQSSAEDGIGPPRPAAAVIDNIEVRDGSNAVLLAQDFESGTLGSWTLSALNGFAAPSGVTLFYIRDTPPATQVGLASNFDFTDPTCVWQFTSPGGQVVPNVQARLTSPWVARAKVDSALALTFSGKLANIGTARFLAVWARGKNAGDTHPRWATPSIFLLNSGVHGADAASPFVNQRVVNFPADFNGLAGGTASDSIQFFFQVEDHWERMLAGGSFQDQWGRGGTLPFLDDVRIVQQGVDRDGDGIADRFDVCPDVSALGQDADDDGCIDPTATFRHVESWDARHLPLHYVVSQAALPAITDGSSITAIHSAFTAWMGVPGATLSVIDDGRVPQDQASALDGVNLVTFTDASFTFPPDIIAVTPTTSFTRQGVFDDRVVKPGEIVDADMIFNPLATFHTDTQGPADGLDLQSVVTHEAGHLLGLNHSGVLGARMFFVIQPGTTGRTLASDDRAALAAAYPSIAFPLTFGAITGQVTRGSNGLPVPGALVTAARLGAGVPVDSTASDYTREDGTYALRGLPAGDYGVRITPLDGDVGGMPLTPDRVGTRLAAIAQTNFDPRWYSTPMSARADPGLITPVTVAAGATVPNIDLVTPLDTIPPTVVSMAPSADTTDIRIDSAVLVQFSKAIDPATLNAAFRLHVDGDSQRLGGQGVLVGNGTRFVFTPDGALQFGTVYVLDITTALTDRQGVPLAAPFSSRFTTEAKPPVAITALLPAAAPAGALITILGSGFDAVPSNNLVTVPCPACGVDTAATVVGATPTSLTVGLPANVGSGLIHVRVGAATSNGLAFTLLAPQPVALPIRLGGDIALGFAPLDVAVAPDGNTVFAVGDAGLAIVNLDAARPPVRVPDVRAIGGAHAIALTPDGYRAVVTRPGTHDVAVIDANPASGTFGQVRAVVPIVPDSGLAQPDGVAMSPNGRRAFVNDRTSRLVYEIDVDTASVTRYQVVGAHAVGGAQLTGGLAPLPDGQHVLLGSVDRGTLDLVAPDSVGTLNSTPAGRIAVSPSGDQALLTPIGLGGFGGFGRVVIAALKNGVSDTSIVLGGAPSDVAVLPQGPAALVTNSAFNQLQVVSLSPATPQYRTKVAEVLTGSAPTAVAVNAFGTLIAVANQASHDLSLFAPGNPAGSLRAVTPSSAIAGQKVALGGDGDWMLNGSQMTIGTTVVNADGIVGGAYMNATVPSLPQQATDISVQTPDGARTPSLTFRVVDPVAPQPAVTGVRDTVVQNCFGASWAGQSYVALKLSPDGRLLVAVRTVSSCGTGSGVFIDVYRASADATQPFGARLGSFRVLQTGDFVRGFDISTDSRVAWVSGDNLATNAWDIQPSSPTFGTALAQLPLIAAGDVHGLASDPMGRVLMTCSFVNPKVTFWDLQTHLQMGGALIVRDPGWSAGISPDGHYGIFGGNGRAQFVSVDAMTLLGVTPQHGDSTGTSNRVTSIAFTRNGRRAAAVFPGGNLAVWNLDPSAGALGAELYFGQYLPAGTAGGALTTGNDLTSLLTPYNGGLLRIDLGTVPPTVTSIASPVALGAIGISPDGRQLWTSGGGVDPLGRSYGQVEMLTLAPAQSLALVSGGGQSGLPSIALPQAVRVQLTGAGNRPLAGTPVMFQAAGGTLDGGGALVRRLTDEQGQASAQWTLPAAYGPTSLTVTALGSALAPLTVDATVVPADSALIPVIVAFGPTDGATGLSAATPVSVTFNQHMDSLTTTPRIQLFANGQPVSGAFRYQDADRYVLFTPSALLPYAARCSLTVAAGAHDQYGHTLANGGAAVFTVQPVPTLALHSVTPPAAPEGAPIVLDGAGFSAVPAQNTVLVNGRVGTVTSATTTSLVLHVPIGATSGPLTVQVAAATSNAQNLIVTSGSGVGGTLATIPSSPGASRLAITPDGKRALLTNGQTNTVSALDMVALTTLKTTTVGLDPVGVVILPNNPAGARAYIANQGGNDVSVLDILAGSPTEYQVVKTIRVGATPTAIGVSSVGPQVLVVSGGSGTLSIIDAAATHGTFDAVTATVNVGSGGQAIAISPDGGRAYVVTSDGHLVIVDIGAQAVTATVNVGSNGQAIAISPDGGTAYVLLGNGTLVAIDVTPGSPHQNQVVATVNLGSSGQAIAITPDGGTAYVTSADGNSVIMVSITGANGSHASSITPGPALVLSIVKTIPVGNAPAGVAIDPSGSGLVLVANQGSGTVTVIGTALSITPVAMRFEFNPDALNLKSLGRWVKGFLQPPPPWRAEQIRVSSIRLNGVVPVDSQAVVTIGDSDHDGIRDLTVKFDRTAVDLAVSAGNKVYVTCTGVLDSTSARAFAGIDSIKVLRGRVTAPVAREVVTPGTVYTVRWDTPRDEHEHWRSVALLHTVDGGRTWATDIASMPNTGSAAWTVPAAGPDSAKVALIFAADDADTLGLLAADEHHEDDVIGVLAVSDAFRIVGLTDVVEVPATLSLAPARPNPASGAVTLRFGLPTAMPVRLELFDVAGRRVRTLVDGRMAAGWHDVRWLGENEAHGAVHAGVFFVRMQAQGQELRRRLVWIP